MTAIEHDALNALAAAYVLDALDAGERRAFEHHLTECAECSAAVRALRPVVTGLAMAVPERTPPHALRDRVLSNFRLKPEATWPFRSWQAWAIAALLLLTVGMSLYVARVQLRVADVEARLGRALQQAALAEQSVADARRVILENQLAATAVLAAPDLARIDLAGQPVAPGASARALWSRASGMVFTATNLPALPAGKVYQVWVVTAQAPISAGLLVPDGSGRGVAVYQTPSDIPAPVAVAVTIEPAGGMPAPTGEKYLVGTV